MASLPLYLLFLATLLIHSLAQPPTAPGPASAAPVNLTAILEKGGQFTTFMRLLNSTQVGNQIANQINTSTEGTTVFSPTDNAFRNLKPGTINSLTVQQQVQLVLYHVLPKYYNFANFQTVSNPVRTQGTSQDGKVFGLDIIAIGNNQVNVSTRVVVTQVNNALIQEFPLAVYQVDKVLLPQELFGAKSPNSSPASSVPDKSDDKAESPGVDTDGERNGEDGVKSMGLGLVAVIGLVSLGFLF